MLEDRQQDRQAKLETLRAELQAAIDDPVRFDAEAVFDEVDAMIDAIEAETVR